MFFVGSTSEENNMGNSVSLADPSFDEIKRFLNSWLGDLLGRQGSVRAHSHKHAP